jgi:diguanylate cyclase (GGDEF)-like protein/PAS domain S-box-containing protein
MSAITLSISVILLFIAAFLSLRLIKTTGRWEAWGSLATALTLMWILCLVALYQSLTGDISSSLTIELGILIISVLMLVGVFYIGPIFKSMTSTNKAQQASEARLQYITDLIPDVVFRFVLRSDGKGKYEYISKGVETLLEKSPDEALADPHLIQNMLLPEHRQKISEEIHKKIKSLQPSSHDLQITTASGKEKWIWLTAIPEPLGEDGSIVWNGIFADITANKKEEKTLKFKLELQKLVSTVSDHFVEHSDIDDAIASSLMDLGKLTLAERSSLWQLDTEKNAWSITHEWCAKNIKSNKHLAQGIPVSEIDKEGFLSLLQSKEIFYCENTNKLPPEEMEFGEFLQKLDIESFAGFSIMEENQFIAWYILNNPRRLNELNTQDISLLKVFGERLHSEIKRREAETLLLSAKEKAEQATVIIETTLDNMGQGILMVDRDGNILVMNNQLIKYLNVSPEETKAIRTFDDFVEISKAGISNDSMEIWQRSLVAPRNDRFATYEVTNVRDQSFEIHVTPLDNGGFVRTSTDITERSRAEEALKKSEEQLRLVMSVTNDGWYDWDLQTNNVYFDPRYYMMAGYEPNEFPGTYEEWAKRVHPEDIVETEKAVNAHHAGEIPEYDVEFRFRRKDGKWMWIRARIKIISRDESGAPLRLVGTHTDITERKRAEEALKESENKYRTLFEQSADAFLIIEEDKFVDCNTATVKMLGYKNKKELLETHPSELSPKYQPDGRRSFEKANEMLSIAFDKGSTRFEWDHKRQNGEVFPVEVLLTAVPFGERNFLHVVWRDITERKQAEEVLRKLSRGVEASSLSVVITDLDGNMEYVNPKFTEVTGYSREEATGQNVKLFRSGETPESTYVELWETIRSGKEWKGELRQRKKDGSLYWNRLSISPVKTDEGEITHFISNQEDVTWEYELSEQLSYQASHDALTGLVNRREFERRAERLLTTIRQDNTEHALCYMDLDQFKVVNDTCGHTAGDEMMRQIATILQGAVRKSDTLARLGGDEFGVLMEHCSSDQAHRVASTLQKAIQDYQFSWEGQSFKVGVSMGLVVITEAIPNLTELLKQADAACYMAKDMGRNRIHVYHEEDASLAQRHGEMQWVTRIYRALEEDRFCLYAQTIAPLDNHDDKHYELLIRMINEDGQLIPPGAFLPAAERYNLIDRLDAWVIEKAFTLLAANPIFLNQIHFVSINLSGQSLTKAEFLDFIITQLNAFEIEGEKICFEVTETAAISNLSTASKFISTLKGLGCQFALDDFGSGLSSFGYLKNLPVDYLKIDGMFVKDIVDDPIDHAMVKSINEIGQVMGMQTIAEFVENDEIKGMLREMGVNYAQGYGIGKPQPFDELLGRVNNVTDINDRVRDIGES